MTIQSNPLWFAESTAPTSESDHEWFCLDRIYLHGTIENLAGFDLIVNTTGPDIPSGIYPVVIDVSGTTYACTAHVWESGEDKIGLVSVALPYMCSACIGCAAHIDHDWVDT